MSFNVSIITLFPDVFPGVLDASIIGRARAEGLWRLETLDLRAFGEGRHKQVDDTPAGGGAGMVLRADIAAEALDSIAADDRPRIYLSPRGAPFNQARAREWAAGPGLVMLAGRFEGLDQRVIDARGLEEVSIGDFVLAGGEAAAQAMIEACIRLLPGVAGNQSSLEHESFETGLLEHPHYTRPRIWEGREIPEVLLSGDHKKVEEWRRAEAEALTRTRRPDLYRAPQTKSATRSREE
ncbi:MAG: tRNA (guanosine(37)-N1)-methyltransferase TrmD [Pseudomonadota bacterium]